MEDEDEIELVMSPLCQYLTEDGYTIRVEIYRGHDTGWFLEVVDTMKNSIVWNDQFPTDRAALNELLNLIKEEGMEAIAVPSDEDEA